MRVGIAGAGIMGLLMSYVLQREGWQVTLFDNSHHDNCSYAAAGMLAPIAELEKCDEMIYHMGIVSLRECWPDIIDNLPSEVYFKKTGSMMFAHPRDAAELPRLQKMIRSKVDACIVDLAANDIIQYEPEITQFTQALYLAAEGQIDNQSLMNVLYQYLLDHELVFHRAFVAELAANKITAENVCHTFDLVIDCRGLGSKNILQDLRPIRGELIWLRAPQVKISRPVRLLHPRYNMYVVPRQHDVYIIGASEVEADDTSEISVQSTLELLSAAYYLHRGFGEARLIKTVTHCRPAFKNHLPQIKNNAGVIAVNGLYRHGFLIAPVLAEEVYRYIHSGFSSICYPEIWKNAA
jgi:glycine oxidase